MKILVTGPEGQVGWELLRALMADRRFSRDGVVGVGRDQLDLANPDMIRHVVRDISPNLIINAAAYTAVDRAEAEPELARAINATAVEVMSEEAKRLGAAVVQFSTDYVFDGTKTSPYLPEDQPNPQSVYGRTKLEGERALIASGANSLILRTCWVYGLRRRNFLLAILRQAIHKPELRVVNDQLGCPTWCREIAQATVSILARARRNEHSGEIAFDPKYPVHHIAAGGSTTWFEFARAALDLAKFAPTPRLIPVSTEEFGAAARRPQHSVLDCQSTKREFGVELPHWRSQLQDVFCDREALEAVLAPH